MSTKNPRYSITVPPEINNQIEDFWHEKKLSSKNKAVTELLEIGLNSLDSGSATLSLSDSEKELIEYFRAINYEGQEVALKSIRALVKSGEYIKTHKYRMVQEGK